MTIIILIICAIFIQSCKRKFILTLEETTGFPVKALINPERVVCQWGNIDTNFYQIEIYDITANQLGANILQKNVKNGLHKYSGRDEELFQYTKLYPAIKKGGGYCNCIIEKKTIRAVFIDTVNSKLVFYSKF